ncbi:MAG: hypothetical protein KGJ55_04485 [Gammaproteobacteria bacterium]|nr:hypothetical protein [Gammaproteobacteria bacterium]
MYVDCESRSKHQFANSITAASASANPAISVRRQHRGDCLGLFALLTSAQPASTMPSGMGNGMHGGYGAVGHMMGGIWLTVTGLIGILVIVVLVLGAAALIR